MRGIEKKILFGMVLGIFCLGLSCVYTKIDSRKMKKRDYKEFSPKQYFEPIKYISADGVVYGYIEKGSGASLVLLHGGVVTYDFIDSYATTPFWDSASALLLANNVFPARAQSLIHFGAISTIDTWGYNFNELSKHFHCIALDLPGFGNSSKPDIGYTVPELSKLLNQFIEAKGLGSVILVGQDFSGLIAIDYAITYPDKVKGLVLVGAYGTVSKTLGHVYWHYPGLTSKKAYREKAARVDLNRNTLKRNGKKAYTKLFFKPEAKWKEQSASKYGWLIYNNTEQAKDFVNNIASYKFDTDWTGTRDFTNELYATHLVLQDVLKKDYKGILYLRDEERADWITRVKLIKAPTLIIWGKFDPIISSLEAGYLNDAIPSSVLNIYEKSAHYPMVEEPEKFNNDIIRFFKGSITVTGQKP